MFLLLLSSASSEKCPYCPTSLCPGETFNDCPTCTCSCKNNKECADGWKCDIQNNCPTSDCDSICVRDSCVENCDTQTLCGNFQCHKDPTAKCVVDSCFCKASFVDANGNEPNCLDGPGVAGPPPDWFPAIDVTMATTQANVTMETNKSSNDGIRNWTIFIIIPLAIIAVAAVISALVVWQKLWRKRNNRKKNESLQEESLKPLNTKDDVIVVV